MLNTPFLFFESLSITNLHLSNFTLLCVINNNSLFKRFQNYALSENDIYSRTFTFVPFLPFSQTKYLTSQSLTKFAREYIIVDIKIFKYLQGHIASKTHHIYGKTISFSSIFFQFVVVLSSNYLHNKSV